MKIDLDHLNREELLSLRSQIEETLAEREAHIRKEALDAVHSAAQKYGFSLPELLAPPRPLGETTTGRYVNPDNPAQTWSGRGRRPGWFISAVKAGVPIDDMEI
ncbi:DNA-binding protein H-NS [Rhodovulum imhoffii]|uniref:DNA-binding protein H-NS n=1 Tax=Rhodovulum imhoffii TaxID=365340 RepID=A0A2T5BL17_9RHOB|nr:H-NS histone family protein [Rhodovulum imhoffii]PTM99682.1 DNA-binding protein H-NS [Rhodovulum imhoffii]